jgi:hypothetical protein
MKIKINKTQTQCTKVTQDEVKASEKPSEQPQIEKLSTEVKPNYQQVPTIIKDNDIIMTDYDLNSILKSIENKINRIINNLNV